MTLCRHNIQLTTHHNMHANCSTAQHNPNPDIRHFKADVIELRQAVS